MFYIKKSCIYFYNFFVIFERQNEIDIFLNRSYQQRNICSNVTEIVVATFEW